MSALSAGSPPSTSHTRQRLPQQLGDFRLLKRIGKGGRSYVFTAHQRLLERTVALKILRPELTRNPATLIAFKREAAAYGSCDHPHILSCYQAGQEGPWHYLALVHAASGDTIQALSGSNRRDALKRVLAWMAQLAEAVDHLQGKGFVHRDIKPANILVKDDDRALLADLGSLHRLDESGLPRHFEGTAAYMSPEQARREPINALTDIFAIGATAWHLLAGRAPRQRCETPQQALRKAAEEPIPALASVAKWVPLSVRAVIERCLEMNPSHRFQQALELAAVARQVRESLCDSDSSTTGLAVDLSASF